MDMPKCSKTIHMKFIILQIFYKLYSNQIKLHEKNYYNICIPNIEYTINENIEDTMHQCKYLSNLSDESFFSKKENVTTNLKNSNTRTSIVCHYQESSLLQLLMQMMTLSSNFSQVIL